MREHKHKCRMGSLSCIWFGVIASRQLGDRSRDFQSLSPNVSTTETDGDTAQTQPSMPPFADRMEVHSRGCTGGTHHILCSPQKLRFQCCNLHHTARLTTRSSKSAHNGPSFQKPLRTSSDSCKHTNGSANLDTSLLLAFAFPMDLFAIPTTCGSFNLLLTAWASLFFS